MLTKLETISICFTTECNYSCSYCVSQSTKPKTYIDITLLYNFIDRLLKYTEYLQINIDGDGEPTLHPRLFEFCEKYNKYTNIHITISTNFSKSIDFYKQFSILNNIDFVISWHSLYDDKYNKEFLTKLNNLKAYQGLISSVIFVLESNNTTASLLMHKMCQFPDKNLRICYPINEIYTRDEIFKFQLDKQNVVYKNNTVKSCMKELCYINSTGCIYKCYTQYILNSIPLLTLENIDMIINLFKPINCNINDERCYQ